MQTWTREGMSGSAAIRVTAPRHFIDFSSQVPFQPSSQLTQRPSDALSSATT
jgi:hypothetical protein